MTNFWEFETWGIINTFAVLLFSLLVAHFLKQSFKFLKKALIPTSVLGGIILLIIATIYHAITGEVLFDTNFFDGCGSTAMEVITYHALALGFIASTLKTSEKKFNRKRNKEIFNTGVTTVATYLLQGILGLGFTLFVALLFSGSIDGFAGALLPFGYGQGTGQALNYGTIFEKDYEFNGGAQFGLTIAALGFISACVGGLIYVNILKAKKRIPAGKLLGEGNEIKENVYSEKEFPMSGSMDNMTVQVILVSLCYLMTFGIMYLVSYFFGEGITSTIFGLNFLIGVLCAIFVKNALKFLNKKNILKRHYTNNFLLTRISNFCFDIMIVSGIAVIRLDFIKQYWLILIIMGILGAVSTFFYNKFIAKKLFSEYQNEQFMVMYGMLTGTASTGIVLLREIDGAFTTPANENLIYQNLPAIIFGFPLMFLILLAPKQPVLTLIILIAFFIVMNIILFREQIFKRKKKVKEN